MKKVFFLAGLIAVLCLCFSSNAIAEIPADGWATVSDDTGTPYNITGGAGGTVVTVNNFADLELYAEATAPYIIQVSGTIDIGSDGFDIHANKTIIGLGTDATLSGNVGFNNRDGNIILENLHIHNPYTIDEKDGLSITQDIHNVLVTKCTVYDCGDGGLDISNRSSFVTVSWCKFHYTSSTPVPDHCFSSLVGARDSLPGDANYLRVTYHHNWWTTGVKERMPRVRYGKVHVYNNYYSDVVTGGYCVGVGCGSRIRVENNYFNAVYKPWKNYYTGQTDCHSDGHLGWNTGNIFYNCGAPDPSIINEYSTIFEPPYDYMLHDTNDIPAMVQAYAGAGTPYPPHWVYTNYGDFDQNGIVNIYDLKTFADYWLVDDCEEIADADRDNDCNVNFYEFALLAEHWLQ
jgi:pectate lyase